MVIHLTKHRDSHGKFTGIGIILFRARVYQAPMMQLDFRVRVYYASAMQLGIVELIYVAAQP